MRTLPTGRAQKELLARRRREGASLPRPLPCTVHTTGAGELDRAGTAGWRAALRDTPRGSLVVALIFGVPAALVWGLGGLRFLPFAIGPTLLAAFPAVGYLLAVRRAARESVPATLLASWRALRIEWKDRSTLEIPVERITGAEASETTLPVSATGEPLAGRRSTGAVVLTRDDGVLLRVETTWQAAQQLVAAIEVARGDLAGRLAAQSRPRRGAPRRE